MQAAQHSSQEIFCLDNAFALIDGTKMAGQVRARRGLLYGAGGLGLVLLTVSLRFLLSQLEERNTGAENTESKWSGREDLNLRLPACKAGKVLLSVTLLPSVSSYYQQLGVPAFAQSATPLASEHRVLIRYRYLYFYLFQNPHAPFHCKMLLLHGKIPSSSFQILPQNSPSLWIKKPKAGQSQQQPVRELAKLIE